MEAEQGVETLVIFKRIQGISDYEYVCAVDLDEDDYPYVRRVLREFLASKKYSSIADVTVETETGTSTRSANFTVWGLDAALGFDRRRVDASKQSWFANAELDSPGHHLTIDDVYEVDEVEGSWQGKLSFDYFSNREMGKICRYILSYAICTSEDDFLRFFDQENVEEEVNELIKKGFYQGDLDEYPAGAMVDRIAEVK